MPRPRPPHLHKESTRHGETVWYFRIGKGHRLRIRGEYGSEEFNANYRAAMGGATSQKRPREATGLPVIEHSSQKIPTRHPVIRRMGSEKGAAVKSMIPADILVSKNPQNTFVYFMRAGSRVKIGITGDVCKRARSLQTSLSERLEIMYSIKGGLALEKYFHAKFKDSRIHGEWFTYQGKIECFLNGLPY